MHNVRVGTCSWTDKTMIERWYPRGVSSAEARLRYYASRFDTVEVDSTFYGLPQRSHAEAWAKRTPEGFVFHIKAYGLMTHHSVDERSLHPELRDHQYELTERGRVRYPSSEMVDRTFEIFLDELKPLRDAGKMGGVLMQFPPYFAATDKSRYLENLGFIEYARERLGDVPMLAEFRHPSWVTGRRQAQTLGFLADRNIAYVSVDSPQFPDRSTMPALSAATAPWAYVRMHGRNRDTFFRTTASAADRFDYLYTPSELAEWTDPIRELSAATDRTWVMFNNCKYDYAPRNAREMADLLFDVVEPRRGGTATGEPTDESADDEADPSESGARDEVSSGQLELGI